MNIEKGKNYYFGDIETYASKEMLKFEEAGPWVVGQHSITLRNEDDDIVMTYIMNGYVETKGGVYELTYIAKDWKP